MLYLVRSMSILKSALQAAFDRFGYKVIRTSMLSDITEDMDAEFFPLYKTCKPYSMTSLPRMYALYKAMEYISRYSLPGDIVECGVWKGGSCMLCASELLRRGEMNRQIYLYDTFKGMAAPTDKDVAFEGKAMQDKWQDLQKSAHNDWCYSSLEDVKRAVFSVGYPKERFTFVEGKVEDTIPGAIPEQIAILRLDTDWYESTKHELTHLFPRLVKNGVLIIDDYGHWKGARGAVDEYFQQQSIPMLLHRVDYTGRVGIKVDHTHGTSSH